MEIVHKDPGYPNSDLECACGMIPIWNNKARMYKECPEHKAETDDFVDRLCHAIQKGKCTWDVPTNNSSLNKCTKDHCRFKKE